MQQPPLPLPAQMFQPETLQETRVPTNAFLKEGTSLVGPGAASGIRSPGGHWSRADLVAGAPQGHLWLCPPFLLRLNPHVDRPGQAPVGSPAPGSGK